MLLLLLAFAFIHSSENVTGLYVHVGGRFPSHARHVSLRSLFKDSLLSRLVVGLEHGCFLHVVTLDGFALGRLAEFSNLDFELSLCIRRHLVFIYDFLIKISFLGRRHLPRVRMG